MAKIRVATIEVQGLGPKGSLRLTELGATPLANGAQVKVPVEMAHHLTLTHQSFVKPLKGDINHIQGEEFDAPAGWKYEILSGKATSPVDTSEKKKVEPAKVGKPANRSMGGKVHHKKAKPDDEGAD